MLDVQNLRGGYGKRQVLHGISFTAEKGTITAIIGPNGCGKSTLLKSVCGIQPSTGQVLLDGQSLSALPRNLQAQNIAYLAQNRQTPDISVRRLILHGRFPYLHYPRRYRRGDYETVDRVMAQLGLTTLADTPLTCLSGGQQPRVYSAMALAQETPVIALDEPTTYLDIAHQIALCDLAKQLTVQGKTLLMALHDLPQAFSLADRILLLDGGTVAALGSPEEVYQSGLVDTVFGIRLCRTETETGPRYHCEAR